MSFEKNLTYWLQFYDWEDFRCALSVIKAGLWWAKDPTPTLLTRTKDKQGNPVDYIGELLEIYNKKFKNGGNNDL
jgi:hypothetical protein